MTDEEKKLARAAELDAAIKAADKKRADEEAAAGKSLDKTLNAIGDGLKACTDAIAAIGKRMDVFERGDAEKAKAKDDAEAMRKRIADIEALGGAKRLAAEDDEEGFDDLPSEHQAELVAQELGAMKPEEREGDAARKLAADSARRRHDEALKRESKYDRERRHELLRSDAWARADFVFNSLGMKPPSPWSSERPRAYRARLLRAIQRHSPTYKEIDLTAIKDPKVFSIAEDTIYADSMREAPAPQDIGPGRLIERTKKGPGGHTITEWHGSPAAWMSAFAGPVQLRATGNWNTGNLNRGD